MIQIFKMKDCPACEEQARELKKVKVKDRPTLVQVVDVNEQNALADLNKIVEAPTILGYRHGKVVYRHVGVLTAAQLSRLMARLAR